MRLVLASLLLALGCVEQGPGPQPKKIDPSYVQAHLLATVPADLVRFDEALEDKVIYLGNKVDRTRVAPGQAVTITHYWKVLGPVGPSWTVFTLVRGPAGTADFMNLIKTDMQIAHGPEVWEAGEIIEDVQTFTVRPDWRSQSATVLVGLVEVGKHGTLDRMATSAKFKERAIVARVLEIDLSRAPAPKGFAHVPRAGGAITIDGSGNDLGWAGAAQTELTTAEGSGEPVGKALAKLTWDDQFLYVFVTVTDNDITTIYKQQDDPLWKGDCVELFIDADGNKRGYVELQVNPNNVTFDSWFAATRSAPGDEAWDSGMVTGVKLRGTAEPGGDSDQGWDAEIAIPWAAVKGKDEAMAVRIPPQVGDRWRLNVVRVDRKTSGKPTDVTAASWNRITTADFHALDRMLTVVFADTSGSIVPNAPPLDTGSGSAAGSGSATGSGSAVGSGSAAGSGSATGSAAGSGSAGMTSMRVLDLPKPATEVIDPTRQSLVIEIPVTGEVVVGGKPVADAMIDNVFRAAFARDKATQVVFQAQQGVAHARVVTLMERAKLLGLTRLAIGTTGTGSGSAAGAVNPADTRIKLDLPSGTMQEIDPTKKSLVIEIPVAGDVVIGGKAIRDGELDGMFRRAFALDKTTQVILRTAKGVSHAKVVGLMERAKQVGLENLAIATQ